MVSAELWIAFTLFGLALSIIYYGFRNSDSKSDNATPQHNAANQGQSIQGEQPENLCPICGQKRRSGRTP